MKVIADSEQAAGELRDLIGRAAKAIAFTGAGISTESGVPDYRSKNSPWVRNAPIPFEVFMADPDQRIEAWRRKFAMDDLYAGAQPSRGHRALSHLVQAGRIDTIITQNIDGLHQVSGVSEDRLIEMHGNGTYATCLTCSQRYELPEIRRLFEDRGEAPQCAWCGGIVKSATISFGQSLPTSVLRAAHAAALASDLFIAIGSSLVVYPAAALPVLAQRNGAKLVILNGEATPLDSEADLVLRGDIGEVLNRAVAGPDGSGRPTEWS